MTTSFAPSSPASLVVGAREELAGLNDVLWAAKTAREKLDVVAELEKFKSQMAAIEAELVADVDGSKAAAEDQWGSAGDYLTAISGGFKGSGAATIRLAKALTDDRTRTLDALRTAAVSRAQAQVIVTTIDALPVKAALRLQAEQVLLEHAKTFNASELREIGKLLIEVLDPTGSDRKAEKDLAREERAAHLSRFFTITEDAAGGVWLKGRTTVEDAAVIKAALFPLAAPSPATPGTGADGDPAACNDGHDARDHGARLLDALVEGCRTLLGVEVLPESHGATPRVTLTMSYLDLLDLTGPALLETGESLSASAVRRLACDADITPMVLGSASEVLDVGRTQRLVSAAIWKALVARDKHCTFPGCRRPPIACDAHHLVHWCDGGPTSLLNMALLCRAHHTMIHNTPWQIRLNPVDQRPEFIPPARLDPEQKPVRERQPRE